MVYIPPSREALHQATTQLIKRFNGLSHRYTPPAQDVLRENVLQLKTRYSQRVAEKPLSFFGSQPIENKVHIEEIECITRLVLDLPVTKARSPEEDEVQSIILGALMYRYLAIEFDYTQTLDGKILSWLGIYNKDSAALYGILKGLLGINEQNQLDALSIATRCGAYLDYLRSKGARRGSAYIRQEEVDFFDRLHRLISDSKHLSIPILEQIKYLAMIRFFDDLLYKTGVQVGAGFELFSQALGLSFKSKDSLSRADMLSCVSATSPNASSLVNSMIEYLLRDDEVLKKENLPNFVVEMNKRLATYSQYTLLGVYVVALTKSHSTTLTKALETAIGVVEPGHLLDANTRVNALSALGHYLSLPLPDGRDLEFSPMGNYLSLQDDIEQLLPELRGKEEMAMSYVMY